MTAHMLTTEKAAIAAAIAESGIEGFGGRCASAAIAIRDLLGGRGEIVGSFNAAFLAHGVMIGHVALLLDGTYWDADARPKTLDEIESWAMLDPSDSDHGEAAEALGFTLSEDAAYAVDTATYQATALTSYFGE